MKATDVEILRIVNIVRAHKGMEPMERLQPEYRFREELGLESLDVAELAVRIEELYSVDVFATRIVRNIGELREEINARGASNGSE